MLKLHAGPPRGRACSQILPLWQAPGDRLWRHHCARVGPEHIHAEANAEGPQELGALRGVVAELALLRNWRHGRRPPRLGRGDHAVRLQRAQGARQVHHEHVLGAAAPQQGLHPPRHRWQGRRAPCVECGPPREGVRLHLPQHEHHFGALGWRGPHIHGQPGPHHQGARRQGRQARPQPGGPRPLGEHAGSQHGPRAEDRSIRLHRRHPCLARGSPGQGTGALQCCQGRQARGARFWL
mmetsp:Transcript_14587/g.57277  ORF Transcript_14587/g.57277 Transcript_14587/m.57277 type:complete len:238 (+) Transcript_14587:299-1012(+)